MPGRATQLETATTVDAASKAYESWRLTPAPKRAEYLYHVGDILKRRKDEMAREMTREMPSSPIETP